MAARIRAAAAAQAQMLAGRLADHRLVEAFPQTLAVGAGGAAPVARQVEAALAVHQLKSVWCEVATPSHPPAWTLFCSA